MFPPKILFCCSNTKLHTLMARTTNSARKSTKPIPIKKDQGERDSSYSLVSGGKTLMSKSGGSKATKTIPISQERIAEKRPTASLSVTTPKISQKPKPLPKKTSKNILREIKYYQTNIGFLIPRATLVRIIRQTLLGTMRAAPPNELKFTSVSINILHEALENHLVCIIELAYMAARHAKRVTLFPSDIRLINRIKGITI